MFKTNHGVIVSCDVRTLDELKKLVDATSSINGIVGYKVGFILGLNFGLGNIVGEIRNITHLPVIYDHQKAGTDVPQMGVEFAAVMKRARVDSAIIFSQAGPRTQEAFINALRQQGIVPMVGGEMSHEGYLKKEGGYISDESPEHMYRDGAKSGAEFFIVPGTKPESIKKYTIILEKLTKPKFCMPGIGRQGGDIAAAFAACNGHPAYGIVGAAIYNATDIPAAARKFCDEVMKFE